MPWGSNDIGEEALAVAIDASPFPQLLKALVHLSRGYFGWFSKCPSRAFEYPWLFNEIGGVANKSVLDIGAGVSPLPLLLAKHGARVVTVDNSPVIRNVGQQQNNWTEWGYLDYSHLDGSMSSINKDILSVDLESNSFDCIYSVSVVEHLPASVRREIWHRVTRWLDCDGKLLLTIDLCPGTEQLWNYNMGELVESAGEHSDLPGLKSELSQVGFRLARLELLRGLRGSRTDVALLHLLK
jgi:SAM-dependent methyltransferase